jgi:hypothetical protein
MVTVVAPTVVPAGSVIVVPKFARVPSSITVIAVSAVIEIPMVARPVVSLVVITTAIRHGNRCAQ